jgi:N-acetylglucosamine-6-phosphate deacetylase
VFLTPSTWYNQDFAVANNITFTINEPVAFGATQPAITPNQIALRNYENNLLVPAAITLSVNGTTGVTTVTINPAADLTDQTRYYVTWDRYALKDTATRCSAANYLPERIGKSMVV